MATPGGINHLICAACSLAWEPIRYREATACSLLRPPSKVYHDLRQRLKHSQQWIINDVRPCILPTPALKPSFNGPQHLLTFSWGEDDGLGEELQVIWKIELIEVSL